MPNTSHWYTLDELREAWPAAPMSDQIVQQLLDTAQAECEAYAPPLDPDDTVMLVTGEGTEDELTIEVQAIPVGYRMAHLMHTRNIWNAEEASPSGSFGADEASFTLTVHPLDWAVKQRLRPRRVFGGGVG